MKRTAQGKRLLVGLLSAVAASAASAGPFVTSGGKAATPSKYVVNIKTIEFRRSDGSYFTFFSGSSLIDLGSGRVQPGGSGGAIGEGVSMPPGTYDGIRVTVARDFTLNASATAVGPAAGVTCSTGGSTNASSGGYTVQVVNNTGAAAADRTLSIPPEANTAIGGVSGLAIVGSANDFQTTATLPSFTVAARTATPPNVSFKFDVANSVEFLNDGTQCLALILPPTVTVTGPNGSSSTFTNPL